MNLKNSSSTKILAAVLCGVALAGCNAVETVDDSSVIPRPASTVVINGTVSGLSATRPVELTVVTTNNGTNSGSRIVSVRGTNVLRFGAVAAGAGYTITVTKQPFARTCTIANGSGTATADVENVTVTCVPSNIPRFTLTANIASALASAPPAGLAVTLRTEEGTETITPTAGQTSVTFTLPIFYPGANPPSFDYAVTATNTVGGTTNTCAVTSGTGSLGTGTGNITTPTVASCLYTVSAAVSYSTTPACNSTPATAPNVGCTPAIAAGVASAMGAGGLQLALRNQITGAVVVQAPLASAYPTTVTFPGTYPSNASALYEVIVQTHPAGQYCIPVQGFTPAFAVQQGGGLVNLVSSQANVSVGVRCRDVPALANQLKGTYQLDPPTIQEVAGASTAIPAGSTVPVASRFQKRNFLTFFTNGTFIYGTHPSTALAGVEHGFYNYNAANGTLQFTVHADTNGTTANNYDHGLSGRVGYVASGSQAVRLGDVTATGVVKTAGAAGVPGRLSLTFGAFSPIPVAPATTPIANLNPTWSMTEPVQTIGRIQGVWTTSDSKRVFVYNDTTFYGFHAGVNGAPNLQDVCLTTLNADVLSSFLSRRGGDTGCMTTATDDGLVAVGTVDVPNATTTNSTPALIAGFEGRFPGTITNAILSPSPILYTVTPGTPDSLLIQNTLNNNPIGAPVTFTRATTY